MITERDITVWIISALLAVGIGCSRYAKWRTRDKIVRELAAMDVSMPPWRMSATTPTTSSFMMQPIT